MDRTFSVLQKAKFAVVFVNCGDIVVKVSEDHSCRQPYVSCSDNCNFHVLPQSETRSLPKLVGYWQELTIHDLKLSYFQDHILIITYFLSLRQL